MDGSKMLPEMQGSIFWAKPWAGVQLSVTSTTMVMWTSCSTTWGIAPCCYKTRPLYTITGSVSSWWVDAATEMVSELASRFGPIKERKWLL